MMVMMTIWSSCRCIYLEFAAFEFEWVCYVYNKLEMEIAIEIEYERNEFVKKNIENCFKYWLPRQHSQASRITLCETGLVFLERVVRRKQTSQKTFYDHCRCHCHHSSCQCDFVSWGLGVAPLHSTSLLWSGNGLLDISRIETKTHIKIAPILKYPIVPSRHRIQLLLGNLLGRNLDADPGT